MWPLRELESVLPDSFEALEDVDIVALRCRRCRWTAWFSAAGATVEEILHTAHEHRCPTHERRPQRQSAAAVAVPCGSD